MIARSLKIGLAVAAVALTLDQVTKSAILAHFADAESPVVRLSPLFNFVLVANHGVSFGLFNSGAGWRAWIFSAVAIAVVAGLVHALRTSRSAWQTVGMGLIIGGALGNLGDRLRFGSVVDFIDFHIGGWHWYVFNLADAAICIGVGLLMLDGLLARAESPTA